MCTFKTFGKVAVILLFSMTVLSYHAFAECKKGEKSIEKGKYGNAIFYYELCANNHPDSEDLYKLATLYYKGLGASEPRYDSAKNFFNKAAKRGHAPSMLFLGIMEVEGKGTDSPDITEGYKWFMLASERPENKWIYGFDTADTPKSFEYMKKMDASLSPDQKQKAIELAGLYKEEIIMEQANKFFSESELEEFQNSYKKSDKDRKVALENLKSKMASESNKQ